MNNVFKVEAENSEGSHYPTMTPLRNASNPYRYAYKYRAYHTLSTMMNKHEPRLDASSFAVPISSGGSPHPHRVAKKGAKVWWCRAFEEDSVEAKDHSLRN